MLARLLPSACASLGRSISSSSSRCVKKIDVQVQDDTTVVQVVDVDAENDDKLIEHGPETCSLCTCNIPITVRYSDVLILEQFMREDGTVLPKELTGLCQKQQSRIERCVMQAHWAGLFPDKTIAEFDRSGYKRFQRYWKNDMEMFKMKEKVEVGSWYYVRRYNTRFPKY